MNVSKNVSSEPSFSVWNAAGIALIGVSLFLRFISYPLITSDYSGFLSHWFTALQSQGFHAFAAPFSDYAPLYLYFLKLLSYIPVSSLYSIKSLSVVFDILLAFITYRIVKGAAPTRVRGLAFLAAAITFIIPTVLLNSS